MNQEKDSTVHMIGYIQKENILGKDQKRISYSDYYFIEKGSNEITFIKWSESIVKEIAVDSLLKKKSDRIWESGELEIKATLKKGQWDGADKMNSNVNLSLVPGRNGKYLTIDSIRQNNSLDHQVFEGRILKTVQVNKAGRKMETSDLFFQVNGKEYFIKSNEGTISREELEALLKKKKDGSFQSDLIKVKGELRNGLWDTNDPMQQSRVGAYILIYGFVN